MYIAPEEVEFGFIQLNGKTFPALSTPHKTQCVVVFDGMMVMYEEGFYKLSEYEFFKWFGWTPLVGYITSSPLGRWEFSPVVHRNMQI